VRGRGREEKVECGLQRSLREEKSGKRSLRSDEQATAKTLREAAHLGWLRPRFWQQHQQQHRAA